MISLIHNIFHVIVKQYIHDLCRRFVPGQLINVMLDAGIEIFQSGDQHVRILQYREQHNSRILRAAPHQAVNRINVPLIFDLPALLDLQKGLHDLHCIILEAGTLHIAFVCLDLKPSVILQPPEHPVGLIPAAPGIKVLLPHGNSLGLVEIIYQLLNQDIPFHAKGKLMVHHRKQLSQAFPVYGFIRRCQRYKKIL